MGKKLFIGLLVLFAVLYFSVLGIGLLTADSDSEQQQRKQDPEAGNNPALRALDALLAPLTPGLVLNGVRCNGQPVDKIFRLTEAAAACSLRLCSTCRMPNGKLETEDHRRGEIRLYDTGVRAFVFVDGPEKDRPKGCKDDLPATGLRLAVTYTPNRDSGDDGEKSQCWLERDAAKPISLSVLSGTEGGILRLECLGCDKDYKKSIRLRME